MMDGKTERPYEVWLTVTKSYRLRGVVRAIDNIAAQKSEAARVDKTERRGRRRLPPGDYVLEDVRVEFLACAASADAVRDAARPRPPTRRRKK